MKRLSWMFIVSLLVLGTPASAQTVASSVEGQNGGVFTSDPQGPGAAAVTSFLAFPGTATVDFSDDGFGRAVQQPDGVGAVSVDAIFVNGQLGNFIEARTVWTDTATNTTGGAVDYVFDFSITPAALRITDFAGLPDAANNGVEVSFEVVIRADGTEVFRAGASLFGGDNSHALTETGTSLGPVFVPGSIFGYDFGAFSDVLPLGSVPDGGSVTVEYEMTARLDTPGFEVGGSASIGDPFDLSGVPGVSGTLRPDAPIPARSVSWGELKRGFASLIPR